MASGADALRRALAGLVPGLLAASLAAQPAALAPPEGVGAVGLSGTAWQLVAIQAPGPSGARTSIPGAIRYGLLFRGDGTAVIRLDCAEGVATYAEAEEATAGGGGLGFGPLAPAAACPPPSKAADVSALLPQVTAYRLGEGRLFLLLKGGGALEAVPAEGPAVPPPG
jgi:hypothetical protein